MLLPRWCDRLGNVKNPQSTQQGPCFTIPPLCRRTLAGKPGAARKALEAQPPEADAPTAPSGPASSPPPPFRRRTLAGKPGAARKALEALPPETNALSARLLEHRGPFLEDEIDEATAKLYPQEEEADAAAEDAGEAEAGEGEECESVVVSKEVLQAEAKEKGYGKLYAALGGGRKGLEACVAVEALCEVGGMLE